MIKAVINRPLAIGPDTVAQPALKNAASSKFRQKTPLRSAPQPLALASDLSPVRLDQPYCQPQTVKQMCVLGLNHFNISASRDLIERVKQFYIDIVGLSLGPRAHLDHEGYWLYAGGTPIVHLSIRTDTVFKDQKGYFNHISLSCVGLGRAIAKMIATQTPYQLIPLPDIHQTQLFVTDPAGIGVELTFFNESL